MIPEDKRLEWIESYLLGRLSKEEAEVFEEAMAHDPNLAQEVEDYRTLQESFQAHQRKNQWKAQLDQIHDDIHAERASRHYGRVVAFRRWWLKHGSTVAVALLVSLVTFFATYTTINSLENVKEKQESYYRMLKREMAILKRSQKEIEREQKENPERKPTRVSGATGFMVSPNGYLLTNYHVVEGADSVLVSRDSVSYKAELAYANLQYDVAYLKITDTAFQAPDRLPYGIRDAQARLGEEIYTIAYPREDKVFGEGSISSLSGYQGDSLAYQVSIPVNPGNSGGPLFDNQGNLIGMVSAKHTGVDGAAFAIKAKYLMALKDSIPRDTSLGPLTFPSGGALCQRRRPEQVDCVSDYIFMVRSYASHY